MKKITIAIDGYSGCGKSTTARQVAKALNYRYVDSGAMYRAVTLYFLEHHVALTNPKEVEAALASIKISFMVNSSGVTETFLNHLNVEEQIREMRISGQVSQISALPLVRKAMVSQQRKMGKERGLVMDGRDIGTVVFPNAELKIFLTASIGIRAFRRQLELIEKEELVDLDEIIENLQKRDFLDSTREESPLKKAAEAIELDTTHITIEEEVDEVVRLAINRIIGSKN